MKSWNISPQIRDFEKQHNGSWCPFLASLCQWADTGETGPLLPFQIVCGKLLHWSCFPSKSKRFFIWKLLLTLCVCCECCTKLLTKIPNLQFSWNMHLDPVFSTLKFINVKCHIMYFVLLIIALVPWVWNDREQSLSLYCVLGQESVGCTCS